MSWIKYPRVEVFNRESPSNEEDYIIAYEKLNPRANWKNDGLDVSCVKTIYGEEGHALLDESINRGKDETTPYTAIDFILDSDLEINM